jgi:predicted XRE-type DNA-binding protein
MTVNSIEVYESGPNIFADLGLPDADTHFLKAQIVSELLRLARGQKQTQTETGALLGISQPEVSRMFKGHFREYSVERLIGFLTAFNKDVEIVVKDQSGKGARGSVTLKHEAAA